VESLEGRLVEHIADQKNQQSFAPIAWSEAGPRAWTAIWQDRMRVAGDRLQKITPAQFPVLVGDLPGLAVRFGFSPHRQTAVESGGVENAMQLLGTGLAIALLKRGWTVSALPGEDVVFSLDGESLTPFSDVARLARGELTAEEWDRVWRPRDVLELDLGGDAKPLSGDSQQDQAVAE
jgi:hypothetical protein